MPNPTHIHKKNFYKRKRLGVRKGRHFLTFTPTRLDEKVHQLQESCILVLLVAIQPLIYQRLGKQCG